MQILFTLVTVIGATILVLNLSRFVEKLSFKVDNMQYINTQFKYQTLLLSVALVVLAALYFINQTNFFSFFALGNFAAPAKRVTWLGIADGESWLGIGVTLTFFISLSTLAFIYAQFRKSGGKLSQLLAFLPWVLLFSLNNSFSEEIIYRLGVAVPLAGVIDFNYILLFSAIAFGVPHLRGMPNGIAGALMAGLMGWVLAKSVIETNGIFWAWFIHFLQDIIIFSAFMMAATNESLEKTSESAFIAKTC